MSLKFIRTLCQHKISYFPPLVTGFNNTRASFGFCTDRDKSKNEYQSGRVPWSNREGEWYSSFKLFAPKKGTNPDIIRFLQSPIDFRPSKIRSWWRRKKREQEIYSQRYISQRHEVLGNDLAAAHFIVHRGGSVKFLGQEKWVEQNADGEYDLPSNYVPEFVVECLDLSNMNIYYEGFQNFTNLQKLRWLSFSGCPHVDDWCIDRISGEYQSTLEYLDLSGCHQVTHRSLAAMYRLSKLKTLKLNNIVNSKSFELACLLLEEVNPSLSIEGVTYMNIKTAEKEQDVNGSIK